MPLFGAHFSIAGGLYKSIETAISLECGTFQLFTKNASQWAGKPLTPEDIAVFRKALNGSKLRFATAHDSYLINLAAPDDLLYRKSIAAFRDEIERAETLGLSYLVTHPGAHTGSGEEAGLARIAKALDEVHKSCPGYHVQVLLETTAGQGSTLGHRFEHLRAILDNMQEPERAGVCLDTCHVFAAGYPLGTDSEYAATFQQFDDVIGISNLKIFHMNDSAKPFQSRVDRHAGLGLGHIGINAFRWLVNDPRFKDRPMILETPKEGENGIEMDPINLGILRGLGAKSSSRTPPKRTPQRASTRKA